MKTKISNPVKNWEPMTGVVGGKQNDVLEGKSRKYVKDEQMLHAVKYINTKTEYLCLDSILWMLLEMQTWIALAKPDWSGLKKDQRKIWGSYCTHLPGLPKCSTPNLVTWTMEMYCLLVLRPEVWIKVLASFSFEACEGEFVSCLSPSFWWCATNPWPSLAFLVSAHYLCLYLCIHSLHVCASVSKFLLFKKDTSHVGLGACPMPSSRTSS